MQKLGWETSCIIIFTNVYWKLALSSNLTTQLSVLDFVDSGKQSASLHKADVEGTHDVFSSTTMKTTSHDIFSTSIM